MRACAVAFATLLFHLRAFGYRTHDIVSHANLEDQEQHSQEQLGFQYVSSVMAVVYDMNRDPAILKRLEDAGEEARFPAVASDTAGESAATCDVKTFVQANKAMAPVGKAMQVQMGMPIDGQSLRKGFNFEKLVTRGTKSGNPIVKGQWGLFLKMMTSEEASLMSDFAAPYAKHMTRCGGNEIESPDCPRDPVTNEQCLESSGLMKVMLVFGVKCAQIDGDKQKYPWTYWHLIANVNPAVLHVSHMYDMKPSRPVSDCHYHDSKTGQDYYKIEDGKAPLGYVGDFLEEFGLTVQRASCESWRYRSKLPCFLEILRQDLALLDERRFIDYSIFVQVQDFNEQADDKYANMLHVNQGGKDLHIVIGLIDIIGVKTSGRKFQSNFYASSDDNLFGQNKYKVYPYYMACLNSYLFDTQSCLVDTEALTCPSFATMNERMIEEEAYQVAHKSRSFWTTDTDDDRRHRALADEKNCDLSLTCKSLAFSAEVREQFDKCRDQAAQVKPKDWPVVLQSHLRLSDPATKRPFDQFSALAKPTIFLLERENTFRSVDYPAYYFLVQRAPAHSADDSESHDDQVLLCWFKGKHWDQYVEEKAQTNRWPCKDESPYRGVLRLNQIEAVYLRAPPDKVATLAGSAIYIDVMNPEDAGHSFEFFGQTSDAEAWVANLKYVIGFSEAIAEAAASQYKASRVES